MDSACVKCQQRQMNTLGMGELTWGKGVDKQEGARISPEPYCHEAGVWLGNQPDRRQAKTTQVRDVSKFRRWDVDA